MRSSITIAFLILILFVIAYMIASARIVKQGEMAVVERLGRYHRKLKPGLNFIIPMLEKIVFQDSIREQLTTLGPQQVISKDNIALEIQAIFFWKILDIAQAYYEVESFDQSLRELVLTLLRNEIGNLEFERLFAARFEINKALLFQLDEVTCDWGVKVTRVEIQEILPSNNRFYHREDFMSPKDKDKLVNLLAKEAYNSNSSSVDYFKGLLRESHLSESMVFEAVQVLNENPETTARNLVDWAIGKGTNPDQPTFTILGNLVYPLLPKLGLENLKFLVTLSLRYGLIDPQVLQSTPQISQKFEQTFWSQAKKNSQEIQTETVGPESIPSVAPDPLENVRQRQAVWRSLEDLPDAQFEQVLFNLKAYKLPSGNVPSAQSPKASRISALLEWAESNVGCGLDTLQGIVKVILESYGQP